MIKKLIIFSVVLIVFASCKSTAVKTNSNSIDDQGLEGKWELNWVNFSKQSLQDLYPRGLPIVGFDLKQNIITGKNGCNTFSGKVDLNGNKINMKGPMTATKMYCEGQGEHLFMQNLAKTEIYSISNDGKTLQLKVKDSILMSFLKK